jgi:hypothetical protein
MRRRPPRRLLTFTGQTPDWTPTKSSVNSAPSMKAVPAAHSRAARPEQGTIRG